MAFIEISDLNAAGNDLSPVADSFLTKLGQAASRQIFGGSSSRWSRSWSWSSENDCAVEESTSTSESTWCCWTASTPTWCCWTKSAPESRTASRRDSAPRR